jgi:hypothetical protein
VLTLKDNESNNLVEKYSEKYSKEEFDFILSLLPYPKLIDPIKFGAKKKYRKEISGFRPHKLPFNMLKDLYYKSIFKQNDEILAKHTEMLVNNYLKRIDENITEEIDSVEFVLTKIKNNDMEVFEKLTDLLLLENKFEEKKHLMLYFKIIDYQLNEEQINYMNIDFERKLQYQKIECQIENKLTEIFESKIKEMEVKHKKMLLDKVHKIDTLQKRIEESKRNFDNKLSNKNELISSMENHTQEQHKKFLSETKSYEKKVNNLELFMDKLKGEISEKDHQINSLSGLVELKYNEFSKIANEKWTESNQELLDEKEKIKLSIEDLKANKEEILEEINCLSRKKNELEDNIVSFENKAGDIVNNVQFILNAIGFSGDDNKKIGLNKESSVKLERELEEINDKADFIEDLTTNLGICGISNEYSFDLAQYMYATFTSKRNLLLVGYNTRKISDALSYIISGAKAEIITLPLGYNDCNELTETVISSKSSVILIENAVDNISESVYIPLIKQNTDKFLVFSMESSEHISLLPKSILNYLMLVDLDLLSSFEGDFELLLSGVTNQDIFNVEIDLSSVSTNLRHINGLDSTIKLSNVAKLKLAEVMSVIDKQNSPNSMYDILLFSIYMLCKACGKTDELKEFIENQGFNPIILKMLLSAMGDGMGDE